MSVATLPLERLRRRLRWRRLAAAAVLATGLGLLAAALWRAAGGDLGGAIAVSASAVLAGTLSWLWPAPGGARAALADLARHLDRRRPELEESALLLLADPRTLSPLERLQQARAAAAAGALPRAGVLPWRRPLAAGFAGLACALLALGVLDVAPRSAPRATFVPSGSSVGTAALAVGVRELRITIEPPAYTRLREGTSLDLDVHAAAGSTVRWRVLTDGPVEGAALLFADGAVPLTRGADGSWSGVRLATASEIYALRLEAAGREVWRSPSARLEVTPDRAPALEVAQPGPLTEVPADRPGSLTLRGTASDDYGLAGVELLVTLVAGGGEQISVRETRLPLTVGAGGAFERALDLASLGVQKDTELYLRVEALDRRTPVPNRTRSETLRVRAAGPQALAAAGLDAGLTLQPVLEYFRSQRQIILDTEKLVAEAPRIARSEFEQRAQSLAFDQRALRLRYGALLGEEFESGAAVEAGAEDVEHLGSAAGEGQNEDPDHAGGAPKPRIGKDRDKKPEIFDLLPAGMVHQHDAQDEATFFTSSQRTQLKAVLAEMWGAEGALRVFDTKHALPFEYRALKLLKDLQQSARVYVPKIGYEAPELDLARRLKGELDAIHDLSARGPTAKPVAQAEVRRLLASLEPGAPEPAAGDLAAALRVLSQAAVAGDADALHAVDVLRAQETRGAATVSAADRSVLRRALWRALPEPTPVPRAVELRGLAADVRSGGGARP